MKRFPFLPLFLILAAISILFVTLSVKTSFGKWSQVAFQFMFSPLQKMTISTTQSLNAVDKLRQENNVLLSQITKLQLVGQDNAALRDQFQTTIIRSDTLLPAHIVGEPSFIPGVSAPETLIIDRGSADGVFVNAPVVYKDYLLGKISQINPHFAQVMLITNKAFSLTGKTAQTNALGIIRGEGSSQAIFDNVLLSDTLKPGDMVVSTGEISLEGKGTPPNVILGKILSIDKNPSSLFQKANLEIPMHVEKLSVVFVDIGNQ